MNRRHKPARRAFSESKIGARQSGAQMIELALMLPIILLVVFAIIGFSLVFLVQHSLSSAVSQGARVVSVAGAAQTNPETAARDLLQAALPAALYPAGFSFESELGDATQCSGVLGTGSNPGLRCLEFRGFFNPGENPFLSNFPLVSGFLPEQLQATAVVLYQQTNIN